jgi:anti-sigma regulatory factor (Ser/Thr protein kinase)
VSAPPARPDELRLVLPAAHSVEARLRAALREHALSRDVPDEELPFLEFVLSELCSNAIDHGGGEGAREESESKDGVRITVSFRVQGGAWALSVADMGGGDADAVRERLEDGEQPDLDGHRGRGLYLLAGMLDRFHVQPSRDGLGLEFTAVKRWAED